MRLGFVQLEVDVLAVDDSLFDCDWTTEVLAVDDSRRAGRRATATVTRMGRDGEGDSEEFRKRTSSASDV